MKAIIFLLVLIFTAQLHASGFVTSRFGGEHGHATANNATAIYYNPAMLPFIGKTRLHIDGTFAFRNASYTRPKSAIGNVCMDPNCNGEVGTPIEATDANSGKASLDNMAASPFIGVTTNLGIKKLGLGVAAYFPFGGAASWSPNDEYTNGINATKYPGAQDGVQRWWAIDSSLKVMNLSLAAGYQLADWISVGLTVSAVKSEIETVRARTFNSSDSLLFSDNRVSSGVYESRTLVKASGWDMSVNAGIVITPKPIPGLYIGYTFQSKPGLVGATNAMEGTLSTYWSNNTPETQRQVSNVFFKQTLPSIHRWAFRFRPNKLKKFEFRLFGDYVTWSDFKEQNVVDKSNNTSILLIKRNWQNAWGVRAGMSYWLKENIETYLGVGFDGNAVPDAYMDPSLFDMNKYTLALGSKFSLYRLFKEDKIQNSLWMAITWTQVFYDTRTVGKTMQDPNAAGKYEQSIGVANVNLEYRF